MRSRRLAPIGALGLILALAAGTVTASAPATGTWSAVGPAVPAMFGPSRLGIINGSRVGPDGKVYIFGSFGDAAGDPTADELAVWDPATNVVVGLGSNGAGDGALSGIVYDVAWYGGTLYVAGDFVDAGGVVGASYLAAWNGQAWMPTGAFNDPVDALGVADGYLFAGGSFTNAGGVAAADFVALYNGYAWLGVGSAAPAINGRVRDLAVVPNDRLYVVGDFTNAGGDVDADYAASYRPSTDTWQKIGTTAGSPIPSGASVIAVSGSRVVIGGAFADAAGDPLADNIVEWAGTAWTHLGSTGGASAALSNNVTAVTFYGSNVIVGGWFQNAGGLAAADVVAVWNGAKWLALNTSGMTNAAVGLTVAGRMLVASGGFTDIAGITAADGIAAYGLPSPPTAPRSLTGAAGSRRVSLAWAAPVTANGATVRDYVVQYRRVGTTVWRTFADGVRTTRTATVTGLRAGWTYQFRVLAKNDWGVGAASGVVTRRPF